MPSGPATRRSFADDVDLAAQLADWLTYANTRPSSATGTPPTTLLADEAAKGGPLPATAADYGLRASGQVSAEALVAVNGNHYSVPVTAVGLPITVRLHRDRVRLWRDTTCLADHRRAPDGAHQRVINVDHFAPLFPKKPRAQVMLYRAVLLGLGEPAAGFMTELSRRYRAQLGSQVLAVYALYQEVGAADLLAAMALASQAGSYRADTLRRLLTRLHPPAAIPRLVLPGVPSQAEIDRPLSAYEALVTVDVALPAVAGQGGGR